MASATVALNVVATNPDQVRGGALSVVAAPHRWRYI